MNRLLKTYWDLSIKDKLMLVLMITCFVTALSVSLIFVATGLTALRQEQREDLSSLADLVSANTSSALLHNDPKAALKAIAALRVTREIQGIYVLTAKGELFARYLGQKTADRALPLEGAVHAASSVLPEAATGFLDSFSFASVTKPIVVGALRVGTVVLRADTGRFVHYIYLCMVMELVIMMAAFVVAYFFSSRFQELISSPIIRLAGTMREVSNTKNFTVRVSAGGSDEIGLLYNGFNQMLCEIEDRNKILRQRQEHLQQLAHFDPLTRLPNRSLFYDRLTQALHHAQRDQEMVALLFIDLDRFKDVNDTLGHRMGDLLLVEVGRRLASVVRSCDTAARLGGDEFTVFSQNVGNLDNASTFAEAIIGLFSTPFQLEGQEIFVTASLGITLFPKDGGKVDELLMNADMAMYAAKDSGKNTFRFFNKDMNKDSSERISLQADLRRGLEREEFVLFYQPKVNTSNCEITSVEALIRWNHPALGMVLPGKFIPLAEENGLITPLTEWVLVTACRHALGWLEAGHPIPVSVNLPAYHFKRQEAVTTVRRVLEETGLHPSLLELEITESSLLQNNDYTLNALQELKQLGVTISIDDFGTGYSSLSYLNRFQVDTLKIDRSFIWNMTRSEEDRSIVSTIIAMAAALNMSVVAEGVETMDQLSFLRERGCEMIQGYLFSRPVPVEHLTCMLADKTLAARAVGEMVALG